MKALGRSKKRTLSFFVLSLCAFTVPSWAVTFTTNTTIACNDLTYENQDIVVDGATLTVTCQHNFNSLTVQNGGSVTHPAGDSLGLRLVIAGNLTVNAGCSIQADGRGYTFGQGPGAGPNGVWSGGGAHGGAGGNGYSGAPGSVICYGSITQPITFGSAGGSYSGPPNVGAPGGGAIHLTVTGNVAISGSVSALGGVAGFASGGGAGGSIWISTNALSGNGIITANGSAGNVNGGATGGGGGGGRVALYYSSSTFSGSVTSAGGVGPSYGGAGSIYKKLTSSSFGSLTFDNLGNAGAITNADGQVLGNLTSRGRAELVLNANPLPLQAITVDSNSTIRTVQGLALAATVAADVTIRATGKLHADGLGFIFDQGPGVGQDGAWSGGGAHGGAGGNSQYAVLGSLVCYGSITQPVSLGSAGGSYTPPSNPGASGGGAIHLSVTGNVIVDGILSATGGTAGYASGGGAGGSIWISANTLSGAGSISTSGSGGNANIAGGGGGGRIALYYNSFTFAGALTSCGGSGFVYGGAGSIYTKQTSATYGSLVYDNCDVSGAVTRTDNQVLDNVTVRKRAEVVTTTALSLQSLVVDSNSVLRSDALTTLALTIATNATVRATSRVHADGLGYPYGQGPAFGQDGAWSGGAAHGGGGGNGLSNTYAGNTNCYDDAFQPIMFGSGGGSYTPPGNIGGSGGGAIRLIVTGTLTVDGALSANSGVAGYASGGGGGGAIWITTNTLTGAGSIAANGGAGNNAGPAAGGGGGGRIAYYYTTSSYGGTFAASGGSGFQNGGAGSIYRKRNADTVGKLLYDNSGLASAAISEVGATQFVGADFSAANGANILATGTGTVNTLGIDATSTMWADTLSQLILTANSDANIAGGLLAVGRGYPHHQGIGAAADATHAGGGSYAGIGGNGAGGIGGPYLYGQISEPVDFGSGGGRYAGNPGGYGGGAMKLAVMDTLLLNGTINANGSDPAYASGGGSGGSIWLRAGTLIGTGTITADGSAGNLAGSQAGGGGGGRIAIYACNNGLPGANVHANGGTGFQAGGNGTVFYFDPAVADSNHNGTPDRCEAAAGLDRDANGDQVLDHLEPFTPPSITAYYLAGVPIVRVRWEGVPRAARYYVYRSLTSDVAVIPGNLIATITKPELFDVLNPGVAPLKTFYKVIAEQ